MEKESCKALSFSKAGFSPDPMGLRPNG